MISIAEAKNKLPALIHQVEAGETVTISRRGKAVAVVVSMEAFERMKRERAPEQRKSVWDVLQQVRAELAAADGFPDWTNEEIDSWRDRTVQAPRCDFSGPEYDWADSAVVLPRGRVAEDQKSE